MFYIVMSIIALSSCVIFYKLQNPEVRHHNLETQAIISTAEEIKDVSIMSDIKSTASMLIDKRMLHLAPQLLWSGITLAIMNGLLVFMISDSVESDDPNSQMMKGVLTLIPLGLGEIIGSIIIGKVIDTYGNR